MKHSFRSRSFALFGLLVVVAASWPALAQATADAPVKAPLIAYTTYKTLHMLALLTLFTTTGALFALAGQEVPKRRRVALSIVHGLSLFAVLVGGFGLMARIGIAHNAWPLWIKLKVAFWIAVGGLVLLPKRMPKHMALGWGALALCATILVLVVQHKPD